MHNTTVSHDSTIFKGLKNQEEKYTKNYPQKTNNPAKKSLF
jgi:hypothetical protein